MILVDTSVWIDYFNGRETPQTNILDTALINDFVAIGDLILLEILQGIKVEREYQKTKIALAALEQYEMFGHQMVEKCAQNFRFLRKKGSTIRKINDVIIATFCIENNLALLFSDRDFIPFVEHLGLVSVSATTLLKD
ncbi:MAG: PIN domain-containing protein [Methyloprofundus sp.]|nr:PIN domain-containing protein [Methyloprofundus sp.]